MIKFAIQQWDKNKDKLEEYYKKYVNDNFKNGYFDVYFNYDEVVKNLVKYVYNDDEFNFNPDGITEIDNGDYQGTLLYLIPEDTYQPSETEYLMTYAGYGSCSGCDTLLGILEGSENKEEAVKELMDLSLHLVQNTIKPYNTGWAFNKLFEIKE